jgi:hypothetical protein
MGETVSDIHIEASANYDREERGVSSQVMQSGERYPGVEVKERCM